MGVEHGWSPEATGSQSANVKVYSTPPLMKYGSPVMSVSAASTVPKLNGSPPESARVILFSAAASTISVSWTSPASSVAAVSLLTEDSVAEDAVGEASIITASSVADTSAVGGTSVAAGPSGVASTVTGASVASDSSAGGRTSGVSAGGGVASSAKALMGKTNDNTNESKTTIDRTVNFFAGFIVVSPSPSSSKKQA